MLLITILNVEGRRPTDKISKNIQNYKMLDSVGLRENGRLSPWLQCMPYLAHLILPTYCTNNLVRALATTCR